MLQPIHGCDRRGSKKQLFVEFVPLIRSMEPDLPGEWPGESAGLVAGIGPWARAWRIRGQAEQSREITFSCQC